MIIDKTEWFKVTHSGEPALNSVGSALAVGAGSSIVAELDSDVFDGAWMLGGADSIFVLVELVSAAAVLDAGSVI